MIVARIGTGGVRHVVDFRPDLDPCWRSLCRLASGGAGSLTVRGVGGLPGCKSCIRTMEDRLAQLKGDLDG